VVRVGGEEFLAVFPAASATQAMAATEAVRATVEARPLEVGPGEPLRLTCSFGVFVATPGQGIPDLQDAQFQADRALYRSKAEGRNRVTLAD
jgi:diguanylate cyclase (GGDEF)-like protein